jgi:hypothetical protein
MYEEKAFVLNECGTGAFCFKSFVVVLRVNGAGWL